jgi:hypothetical protein
MKQNEGAQMSNELECDRAMVINSESFGVDGVGYDETEAAPGAGAHFNSTWPSSLCTTTLGHGAGSTR